MTLFVALGILFLILIASERKQQAGIVFYSAALREAKIDETVFFDGRSYQIHNGMVVSLKEPVPGIREKFVALRLAYALALARRAPMFSLEGSDPDAFESALESLIDTRDALAHSQNNPKDELLVRESLYPIRFLLSLVETERARRAFISSGSAENERHYRRSVATTVQNFETDLRKFRIGFEGAVQEDASPYTVLGGTITRQSFLKAIGDLQALVPLLKSAVATHNYCIDGIKHSCAPAEIVFPSLPALASGEQNSTVAPLLFQDVLELRTQLADTPSNIEELPLVSLVDSACVNTFLGPAYFLLREQSQNYRRSVTSIEFVGDILLYSTLASAQNKGGQVVRYFAEHGISYLLLSPTAYYQCPNVGSDLARGFGAVRAAQWLRSTPLLTSQEKSSLYSDALQEEDVFALVAEVSDALKAIDTPFSKKDTDVLSALVVTLRDRSAGVEALITEIATYGAQDIKMREVGIPLASSTSYLFFTQSAFLPLFLSHNRSVSPADISLFEGDEPQALPEFLLLWSELRSSVPRKKIIEDINFFFKIHSNTEEFLPHTKNP